MYKKAFFIGIVTTEVIVKEINGKKLCKFTIAGNDKNAQGESVPQYFHCTAWNHNATFMENYVRKGMNMFVEAEPIYKQFEDAQKNKRNNIEFDVIDMRFADGKKDN